MISKITKIFVDRSSKIELPLLFSEEGMPIETLLDYQLARRSRSLSWHRRLVFSVRLLLEYAAANPEIDRHSPKLLECFVARLANGTTESGLDPSGLHWMPRKPSDVRAICRYITGFSLHLAEAFGATNLNPRRDASWHDRICNYAGQVHRHRKNLLSHLCSNSDLWDRAKTVERSYGRLPLEPRIEGNRGVEFPKGRFGDLIFRGFAVRPHQPDGWQRLNIRDVLITLLLHGGGLRCSEPFHMYISDVAPNPLDPTSALVRIGHPSLGEIAWRDPLGRTFTTIRAEYLQRHGLPRREIVAGPMHAGWKNPVLDGKYYLQVRWADPDYGRLFLSLWTLYLQQYLALPARTNHPWAWVSFQTGHLGEPLKMGRFIAAHDRAVRRIGLEAIRSNGTKPHAHRHAYAKWLMDLGLSGEISRRFLHHASVESQRIYQQPTEIELHNAMQDGINAITERSGSRQPTILTPEEQREADRAHSSSFSAHLTGKAHSLLESWNAMKAQE